MKLTKMISIISVLIIAGSAAAEVPDRLIYSGNLVDNGQPYQGAVNLVFGIYDAANAGTLLWSESHEDINVSSGKFSVELGLADSLIDVFDGNKYYLQVSVAGQAMLPRVPVASVPYAFKASKADDSDTVGGLTPDQLGGDVAAADVSYVNTQSGLTAEDVQAALDEVVGRLDVLQTNYETLQADYTTLQQAVEGISWNDLADIPAGFADGVDNEASAGSVNWADITDIPADIADGDDVGLLAVSWNDLSDIPAGFADGTDDEGLTTVSWLDLTDIPAEIADGDDVGMTSVTWLDINNRPAGLDDGDDVGLTSVSWFDLTDIPAEIADGDDVGMTSVTWLDINNRPAGLDDGDDLGLTSVSWDDITDTTNILYDGTDFIFRNLNVHVQSGSGSTNGAINGRGNLIVGYDEERNIGSDKSGSHNLVVGINHNYTSFGGLVAGYESTISGQYSAVSGGQGNSALGDFSSVSGGGWNYALGNISSVSGGYDNTAVSLTSSVSGGTSRTAPGSGDWAAGSLWEDD
jgi:hypothetical protein